MLSAREVFDSISLSVLSFLDTHDSVRNVELEERRGASQGALERWDKTHALRLPDDLRSFLSVCNGVQLTWSVRIGAGVEPLGRMHLNALDEIQPVPVSQRDPTDPDSFYDSDGEAGAAEEEADPDATDRFEALLLDASEQGEIVLLFRIPAGSMPADVAELAPLGVYYQDLACGYHFVAKSFTDFFRLMICHLGLPGWQFAFTPYGQPPATARWLQFFSPERRALDEEALARPPVPPPAPVASAPAAADAADAAPAADSMLNLSALVGAPSASSAPAPAAAAAPVAAPAPAPTASSRRARPGSAPPRSPDRQR